LKEIPVGPRNILVIDNEVDSRQYITDILRAEGYDVRDAADAATALRTIREHPPGLILLDLALTDTDPGRLIRTITNKHPDVDIILSTRQRQIPKQTLHLEVSDYIEKPIDPAELLTKIRSLDLRYAFYNRFKFIGKNEKIVAAMESVIQIAPTQIQVLITGESGTGKEVIAQAIHAYSKRSDGPFVAVNCGAIAEGVLESELFGHEKGAFTDAKNRREGYFEKADGGTIFLDELGEMPSATQVKLLRVLEQQEFMRVGGSSPIKVNVRIIAATNKDLHHSIRDGSFRQDLYYRLNAVNIHLPALRERSDDVPRLLQYFMGEAAQKHQAPAPVLTEDAVAALVNYNWPGNIRELRNMVETLVVTSQGRRIDVDDLPDSIYTSPLFNRALPVTQNKSPEDLDREMLYKILWQILTAINEVPPKVVEALQGQGSHQIPSIIKNFQIPPHIEEMPVISPVEPPLVVTDDPMAHLRTMEDWEREAIRRALERHQGHREKAARELRIGERTIYRKIKDYGLDEFESNQT
jgi:DNA-binding NtrC family response regulator